MVRKSEWDQKREKVEGKEKDRERSLAVENVAERLDLGRKEGTAQLRERNQGVWIKMGHLPEEGWEKTWQVSRFYTPLTSGQAQDKACRFSLPGCRRTLQPTFPVCSCRHRWTGP